MNVIIAGAGIGGLTLGAALRHEGIPFRIFERANALKPLGAGITVQINAMRALAHYGFDEAVRQSGAEIDEMRVLDWKGRQITRGSIAQFSAKFGQPTICVHRARLHQVLRNLLAPESIALNSGIARYREADDGVVVTLENGEELRADLLVGCDGLHSMVRTQMLGESQTRYSGYTSWRGVCSEAGHSLSGMMSQSWGRGARFGVVPIGAGELYWFATANAAAGQKDGRLPDELLARFGAWHAPIPDLLRATSAEHIIRTDIVDRPPVSKWTSARVALLGDAAHPMTPNLAQGACQAIEDAVVLARLLGVGGELRDVLRAYEARRVKRANGLVNQSKVAGALSHWENEVARGLRDGLMRVFSSRMSTARLDALYGFET